MGFTKRWSFIITLYIRKLSQNPKPWIWFRPTASGAFLSSPLSRLCGFLPSSRRCSQGRCRRRTACCLRDNTGPRRRDGRGDGGGSGGTCRRYNTGCPAAVETDLVALAGPGAWVSLGCRAWHRHTKINSKDIQIHLFSRIQCQKWNQLLKLS